MLNIQIQNLTGTIPSQAMASLPLSPNLNKSHEFSRNSFRSSARNRIIFSARGRENDISKNTLNVVSGMSSPFNQSPRHPIDDSVNYDENMMT